MFSLFFKLPISIIFFLALLFSSSLTTASVFTLPTIESSQTDAIFKTFGANFAFRPLESANDLGAVWGFYLGAGASATKASELSTVSPDAPTYLPYADIHLGVGLPLGFTLETAFTPKVTYQGNSTSKYGGAIKWTATRTVLSALPLSLAARVGYTKGKVDWTQALDSGTVTVGLDSAILETQIAASKMIGALGFGLEPFIGLGYVKHSSTLSGTGTANLFGSSFPAGTATTSDSSGAFWGQAGLTLHLYVVALSAEYDNMFGINSYSGKVTFRI